MQAVYPATYRDEGGEVATTIENNGKSLRMSLFGVEFDGIHFGSFEPVRWSDQTRLSRFSFAYGSLCAFTLELSIPVTVLTDTGEDKQTNLIVQLSIGHPRLESDDLTLQLKLVLDDTCIESAGDSGWFEDELADIQRKLPDHWHLKMCFGCAFSDYSPYGHNLFGDLICYRSNKAGYLAVKGKFALFELRAPMAEFVQETYLCPEFERRKPGTGYRG
jgi:hypothetical protein